MGRRNNGSRNQRKSGGNPRSARFVYGGPIRPRRALLGDATTIIPLFYADNTLDSTGAGVIQDTFPIFDPSLAPDYGILASSWREFRVIAAEMRYFPNNRYSKTTTVTTNLVGAVDVSGSSAFTGYSQAYGYDSSRVLSLEDPWKMVYRLPSNDTRYCDFEPTSSATAKTGTFKLFSSGLSLSTTYGGWYQSWQVEVRGRK